MWMLTGPVMYVNDRKSTSGFVYTLTSVAVSWSSKKQTLVLGRALKHGGQVHRWGACSEGGCVA